VFAIKDSLIFDFLVRDVVDAEAARLGILPPYCATCFDFRLKPAAAGSPDALDAQRRLAALGARAG
jgi:hypothetical protein